MSDGCGSNMTGKDVVCGGFWKGERVLCRPCQRVAELETDRDGWKTLYHEANAERDRLAAQLRAAREQEARDAERYRYIRAKAKEGAVKTLLPLYRAHYFVSSEPVSKCPTFDEAIDAAMLAAAQAG